MRKSEIRDEEMDQQEVLVKENMKDLTKEFDAIDETWLEDNNAENEDSKLIEEDHEQGLEGEKTKMESWSQLNGKQEEDREEYSAADIG